MTTMKHFSTHRFVEFPPGPSNLGFVSWATIISIVLIFMSIAFQVGIDPEVSMLMSP